MKITTETIKIHNPCNDRFNNFIQNYPEFAGEPSEFVNLDKITYSDKIWVLTKIMTQQQAVEFAVKCAESVIHIFEAKYPNDNRPRVALDAARAAAYAADAAYAARAARAAARAAAADAAYAARAARAAARAAARKKQENLNLQFAIEVLGEK